MRDFEVTLTFTVRAVSKPVARELLHRLVRPIAWIVSEPGIVFVKPAPAAAPVRNVLGLEVPRCSCGTDDEDFHEPACAVWAV